MIGRRIGHYRVTAHLGAGGMGVVYRAHDERLERDIALKVLLPEILADTATRRRFRKEALALSALNHPNIQTVHDFDTQDGVDFLVTEYVEGVTLSDRVTAGGAHEKDVLRLGAQLADGLAAAHAQGIVHRDLKPANLRVTPEGRLKILDFGLARRLPTLDGATTHSAEDAVGLSGTLPYMAPEQLRGETIDARTDVFAAGCVLYELATGRRTVDEALLPRITDAILHHEPESPRALNARISAELERIILKCLEKDPNARYQSAAELAVDLRRLESGRVSAVAPSRPGLMTRPRTMWTAAAVGLVALALGLLAAGRRDAPDAPIESLAVLPLENFTGDVEQEYIVAAMHEAVIAELSQISALRMIPRTSVARYRNTEKSVPEIAGELQVDALVEGSVFKTGDRIRVQLQLIKAAPAERQLWSRTYDDDLRNVLTMQKQVARAIAEQIRITMTPKEAARLAAAVPVNGAAYDAWARGWFQFTRLTTESLYQCQDYAAAAAAIDPNYAPAYALSALCYSTLPNVDSQTPPADALRKAETAARRAFAIDDSDAEAHFALAWTLSALHWDWPGAEREFRRGLELNPNSAFGHARFGWFLSWLDRKDEALASVTRAAELNPTGLYEMQALAAVHYAARRYDDAVMAARRATANEVTYSYGHARLALALSEQNQHAEAIAAMEKAVKLSGDDGHLGALGRIYARGGRHADARRILESMARRNQNGYVAPIAFALIHAGLGENDHALRWLEEACRVRDANLVLLNIWPSWDPLRSDVRFQELLRRTKFR